ncbi:unnamed protein product [Pedinophyceae sp. YPF-701]|nr:unnamed protein product [Pedinophyceae sp. YPF-701]
MGDYEPESGPPPGLNNIEINQAVTRAARPNGGARDANAASKPSRRPSPDSDLAGTSSVPSPANPDFPLSAKDLPANRKGIRPIDYPPHGTEVYVRGLAPSVTPDDLLPVFARIGRVFAIRMIDTPRGSNSGSGFVMYEARASADAAVRELQGRKIKGRAIGVEFTNVSNRLYLRGVPQRVGEDELIAALEAGGVEGITKVGLQLEKGGVTHKGRAFITFLNHICAREGMRRIMRREATLPDPRGPGGAAQLDVEFAKTPEPGYEAAQEKVKCVHVAGLPGGTTAEDLTEAFRPFGDIEEVRLGASTRASVSGAHNFGFVSFAERASALAAIEHFAQDGVPCTIRGTVVGVHLARPEKSALRKLGSDRTSMGSAGRGGAGRAAPRGPPRRQEMDQRPPPLDESPRRVWFDGPEPQQMGALHAQDAYGYSEPPGAMRRAPPGPMARQLAYAEEYPRAAYGASRTRDLGDLSRAPPGHLQSRPTRADAYAERAVYEQPPRGREAGGRYDRGLSPGRGDLRGYDAQFGGRREPPAADAHFGAPRSIHHDYRSAGPPQEPMHAAAHGARYDAYGNMSQDPHYARGGPPAAQDPGYGRNVAMSASGYGYGAATGPVVQAGGYGMPQGGAYAASQQQQRGAYEEYDPMAQAYGGGGYGASTAVSNAGGGYYGHAGGGQGGGYDLVLGSGGYGAGGGYAAGAYGGVPSAQGAQDGYGGYGTGGYDAGYGGGYQGYGGQGDAGYGGASQPATQGNYHSYGPDTFSTYTPY